MSDIHATDAHTGRLSRWQAAMVIARRDFLAILLSRTFIFFLLGPLFPIVVGVLAGGIGSSVRDQVDRAELGVMLAPAEAAQVETAHARLFPQLDAALPAIQLLDSGDPSAALKQNDRNLGAVLTGSIAKPELIGTEDQIVAWEGPIGLLLAEAKRPDAVPQPPSITLVATSSSTADVTRSRLATAQSGQVLLFLLIMLLAGMVLSNLVEEKGNKVIEILAAAVPMESVFLGKLFAMLAVSMVGVAVWGIVGGAIHYAAGNSIPVLTEPAVGWPLFFLLGVIYFAMGYLLLGSVFLAIGSLATTVREVQTLSMPVTMLQLMVFFFASYALAATGSWVEWAAIVIPFSSPFAMFARAAFDGAIWPHLLAIAWQALCVGIFVTMGARLFRRWVMKSGPRGAKKRSVWSRAFGPKSKPT
ncbi:ABC transporter permease [Pseudoblastomonas halimionae]|uniref:ABC transporter permease n=1 Tax=Alteriqipengyuania halimionae TaxID=1926630 RepID=A0A6I4U4J8_9SPHN|nr:ABC transporter permease [Alteriqipengyuania halimionae]MXP10656.1 ABC transporter permease [Alteriqipengyuania halimionae]